LSKKQKVFLAWCAFVKVLTIFALLFLVAVNVLLLMGLYVSSVSSFMYALIRVYNMVFSFLSVAIEFEVKMIVSHAKFLETWPGRGMFYIFLGVLTLEANPAFAIDLVSLVQLIAGWLLIALGGIYFIMGLFGLRSTKEKLQAQADNKA